MKYSLLQPDFIAGDLEGNADLIIKNVLEEEEKGADLCVFPELALIGYVPCDYFAYGAFIKQVAEMEHKIRSSLALCKCALVFGSIGSLERDVIFNRAYFIHQGKILAFTDKKCLKRVERSYFRIGAGPVWLEFAGKKFLLSIGADLFSDALDGSQAEQVIINLTNDHFAMEDLGERKGRLRGLAQERKAPMLQANAAGACDEVIFAGESAWISPCGSECCALLFEPDTLRVDASARNNFNAQDYCGQEMIFKALAFGVREYCRKTGQNKIVLGLSGGIDSALVAVIACKALGPENVTGILMPSPWSSAGSVTDAQELAKNLGMKTAQLPIHGIMRSFDATLAGTFAGLEKDVTEENLQARIRGDLVMALANKFRAIALATGNKSEIAVGYCTMYGDTCGALEPIGDLYKTEVYGLCNWLNGETPGLIPVNILEKAPSAELRPGQKDQDSLPPYEILDPVLKAMLDERLDVEQVASLGFDPAVARKVAYLVARAQFKRGQTAPALLVHRQVALDMPVAGRFPFEIGAGKD